MRLPLLAALLAPLALAGHAWADQPPDAAAIRAFEGSKISLADAIAAAQKSAGGQAMDVSFQTTDGTPSYDATVFAGGAAHDLTVNAATAAVTPGPEGATPEAKLDAEDKAELAALRGARLSLTQAVAAAERDGGRALDAGLEQRNGRVEYQIRTVRNGTLETVIVDPVSGATRAG